jgi:hypothetical protein
LSSFFAKKRDVLASKPGAAPRKAAGSGLCATYPYSFLQNRFIPAGKPEDNEHK